MLMIPTPLKLVRLARGLIQGELAARINTYQTRISRLESGSLPTEDEVIEISKALETSPDVLFPKWRREGAGV